ncbi:hypothetical protein [Pelagerythrobacter rhizovicinus]|uniref:Uncharacterized protein n=1 Tax=Pelagerythrobacter rhizovicinus TaxID=2268576 RepID=A0A4Q2KJ97_9SPHN|nr:hypothetical protein [Pelagerythrobacter rhizovicinus]RXZ64387.1 hypothetical protein ETX26_10835 [Pelagerythrobacter rhizovicinus]
MGTGGSIVAGGALAVLAVAMLRISWGQRRRSIPLNAAGWAVGLAALVMGWGAAGAWGASVVSLWAMGAACAILAWEGLRSPAGRSKASNRRAGMMPEGPGPLRLGSRLLTFVLVAVAASMSSIAFALGVRWLAAAMGAGEADANVLALFATPVVWTVLAFALLMAASRKRQIAYLAVTASAALPAFLLGAA